MIQFLLFSDAVIAREWNRAQIDKRRKSGNPDGDGKPYITTECHVMRVAEDGQAVLEIKDDSQLTLDEKRALVEVRPSKFDPPEEDGFI